MSTEPMSDALKLVADERQRQVAAEGRTPEHDDLHTNDELALAAAAYAIPTRHRLLLDLWPWVWGFKPCPHNRVKELVKAGALILAEIERLQRADQKMDEPVFTCKRCGSHEWVAASLDDGVTRIAQCVPCGRYSADLVESLERVREAQS